MSWFDPSLRPQDIQKLKHGHYTHQGMLDLHGMTQDQATQTLNTFLREKLHQGARFVLIIHGKGYNSDAGPILKQRVIEILESFPSLLGFCSALPKDGGTGALYILFKKQRSNNQV
ncbi:DNA mismatch repair protein MutS [Thiomicrospira aerophila AL3]|uniref:DNA mismatch repair protein MutS n=1 Tax=Thiomicrospira aerophila AL3 TaxID=717772 RepID=W0DWE0_9GAMM|nr:DNA mismatch repair protein MutS [Thiomicrospira aerophila AL3]